MKAVLTYHSIDDSGSPISIAPAAFEAHARWLVGGRVRVLPLDEFAAHPDAADDAIAVTFDDGFRNNLGPLERLRSDGVPFTVFVVTRRVGLTNAWGDREQPGIPTLPLLGWKEIERLAARGALIASHSRTHPVLTGVTRNRLAEELLGSAEDLQVHLGVPAGHFAYPYGEVDDGVEEHARRYYSRAYTTDFRMSSGADSPFRCPRLDMYYFRRPEALDGWGSSAFRRRVAWCRSRRAIRGYLRRAGRRRA